MIDDHILDKCVFILYILVYFLYNVNILLNEHIQIGSHITSAAIAEYSAFLQEIGVRCAGMNELMCQVSVIE